MTDTVLAALREIRLPYAVYEMDIHRHVREALDARHIAFAHEAKLSAGCRIDYLAGGVGIEIKKGKPNAKRLTEQLEPLPAARCAEKHRRRELAQREDSR